MIKNIDWDTTCFLIGIFIIVGAISKIGLLNDFSELLSGIIGDNKFLGFVLIVGVSMIISGFVDNVPYIIAMLPVAATLAQNLSLPPELYMFGLLVGSCMGGNLTPFGASANVVSVGILRKQGIEIDFGKWLKIGLPFTVLTTAISALFVWFNWG
jgi:Na+/H+ antiporter NhaD/arsenite permease-like protein